MTDDNPDNFTSILLTSSKPRNKVNSKTKVNSPHSNLRLLRKEMTLGDNIRCTHGGSITTGDGTEHRKFPLIKTNAYRVN